jgi:hypothetical protein
VERDTRSASQHEVTPEAYEPPQVERVMDSEELAREVHYAGIPTPS